MPFIPHTEEDIAEMLASIGADSIEALFDEIPADLKGGTLKEVPPGLSEMEITRLMMERASQDGFYQNYIGAGAYEHHIPAAVWQITTRGEFYSSYTPYQAEASQGTLQLLYEYQTMMASLTGMDVSNASMYDGATALAEAALMAVRSHKSSRRILIPETVHPVYRKVARAIVSNQKIEIVEVPFDQTSGQIRLESLDAFATDDIAALVIPQPNFFGVLEQVDALTDWAHSKNALAIGVVNPVALALLKPPGEWGETGADIAVGEGQPLGIPLSSGGPYFGFMACKNSLIRQIPGRIIGRTNDLNGKPGFVLTLQAREQHIRRSKATSNICTNQGLMVTAATIYMSLLGPDGLRRVAAQSHANTSSLIKKLTAIPGVEQVFGSPFFHEAAIGLPSSAANVLAKLKQNGILGGFDLQTHYPGLENTLLVCATETKTEADIENYVSQFRQALG
ncbi:MAG: aminomethyl-transferring glycine dehydrogenase subunit GcvPA [Nitrosomonas sp.]|nr:aminomethyl-transferring glycine dehydrogenase subunit GcvPA [Nitrosomonas sp.]